MPKRKDFLNKLDLPLNLQLKKLLFDIASIIVIKPTNWNVGLFWNEESGTTLGSHFDDDEVYTVHIFGQKEWQIDGSNINYLRELLKEKRIKPISSDQTFSSSETWIRNQNEEPQFHNPKKIIMKPGDLLISPAYALHKVTSISEGENLSINVGIRRSREFIFSVDLV